VHACACRQTLCCVRQEGAQKSRHNTPQPANGESSSTLTSRPYAHLRLVSAQHRAHFPELRLPVVYTELQKPRKVKQGCLVPEVFEVQNQQSCASLAQDLKIDDFSRSKMEITAKELTEEREMALASLQ